MNNETTVLQGFQELLESATYKIVLEETEKLIEALDAEIRKHLPEASDKHIRAISYAVIEVMEKSKTTMLQRLNAIRQ